MILKSSFFFFHGDLIWTEMNYHQMQKKKYAHGLTYLKHTNQPQSCCKVFDFLVDEATKLELTLLALDWLFILRLCAFHSGQQS